MQLAYILANPLILLKYLMHPVFLKQKYLWFKIIKSSKEARYNMLEAQFK